MADPGKVALHTQLIQAHLPSSELKWLSEGWNTNITPSLLFIISTKTEMTGRENLRTTQEQPRFLEVEVPMKWVCLKIGYTPNEIAI